MIVIFAIYDARIRLSNIIHTSIYIILFIVHSSSYQRMLLAHAPVRVYSGTYIERLVEDNKDNDQWASFEACVFIYLIRSAKFTDASSPIKWFVDMRNWAIYSWCAVVRNVLVMETFNADCHVRLSCIWNMAEIELKKKNLDNRKKRILSDWSIIRIFFVCFRSCFRNDSS